MESRKEKDMKKTGMHVFAAVLILAMLFAGSTVAFAAKGYEQVAGSSDMATVEEVGIEGMEPVYGKDVKDGTYDVTVESSSSMFNIEKAELTVKKGKMQAVLTMGGIGYLKLYMGTGKEAAEAELSAYIDFQEDKDGKHTYTVPVEALDKAIPCAAFSKNKKQWYDRSILFEAGSLPKSAVLVELPDYDALEKAAREKRIEAMKAENGEGTGDSGGTAASEAVTLTLEDGEYPIEVRLEGGTGRASIASPAVLVVKEGRGYGRIEWSSPNYDYMIVEGEKYLPISKEGNSTFEIPITVLDKAMPVIADTTAMSTPHEIEYHLIFDSHSLPKEGNHVVLIVALAVMILLAVLVIAVVLRRRKKA